jgi:hypothetical protein
MFFSLVHQKVLDYKFKILKINFQLQAWLSFKLLSGSIMRNNLSKKVSNTLFKR